MFPRIAIGPVHEHIGSLDADKTRPFLPKPIERRPCFFFRQRPHANRIGERGRHFHPADDDRPHHE